jgi:STE24 endopeptidase
MQLAIAIVLIGAVFISENAPAEPVDGWWLNLLLTALGGTCVVVFALVGATTLRGCLDPSESGDYPNRRRRMRRLRRVHLAVWFAASGGILYGLDWTQIVRFNWRLDHTFLLDELLIFAPVLLPLVCSWGAFSYADPIASNVGRGSVRPRSDLLLRVRHELGFVLIPILIVLAANDLVDLFVAENSTPRWSGIIYASMFVALAILFPLILRFIWPTEPLTLEPLRRRLKELAHRVGLRYRDLLIWKSDDQIVNAAVAGIAWPLRYVFLSDGLLRRLTAREIEAVLLHEVAHVRRRHLWWRLVAIAPPIIVWLIRRQLVPETATLATELCWTIGMLLYATLALGWISRRLEFDADLWAYGQLTNINWSAATSSAEDLISALKKLADAAAGRDRETWLHPSVAQRIELLQRTASNSRVAQHHRRETDWICLWHVIQFAVAAGLLIAVS